MEVAACCAFIDILRRDRYGILFFDSELPPVLSAVVNQELFRVFFGGLDSFQGLDFERSVVVSMTRLDSAVGELDVVPVPPIGLIDEACDSRLHWTS